MVRGIVEKYTSIWRLNRASMYKVTVKKIIPYKTFAELTSFIIPAYLRRA